MKDGEEKLTFGDLEEGDEFIAFPRPGDNSGHGGYKIGHRVFTKTKRKHDDEKFCAKIYGLGTYSDIPDTMEVIKVI
jgi:hypothetical protein